MKTQSREVYDRLVKMYGVSDCNYNNALRQILDANPMMYDFVLVEVIVGLARQVINEEETA